MKSIKMMTTLELFSYLDLSRSTRDEMLKAGDHLMNLQYFRAIDFEVSTKLTTRLQKNINEYSEVQNLLSGEIAKRFKKNFKITKGPLDVAKMMAIMAEEHPVIQKSIEQVQNDMDPELLKEIMNSGKDSVPLKEALGNKLNAEKN